MLLGRAHCASSRISADAVGSGISSLWQDEIEHPIGRFAENTLAGVCFLKFPEYRLRLGEEFARFRKPLPNL